MERFFSCLNGWRMDREEEDRILWTDIKNEKIIFKSLYYALELRNGALFLGGTFERQGCSLKLSFLLGK